MYRKLYLEGLSASILVNTGNFMFKQRSLIVCLFIVNFKGQKTRFHLPWRIYFYHFVMLRNVINLCIYDVRLGYKYDASLVYWLACWPVAPKFAGSNPTEAVGFFGRKNPQHNFLRRGSKRICPMSQLCGM